MELHGKVALVTGAGSGIGAATALRLAEEGADIVLVSRTGAEIEKVGKSIEQLGRRALVAAVDVADEKAMSNLFRRIARNFDRLDFVFANAGVNGVWAPIEELKPSEWDATIRINLRGTYLTVHHAVPLMRKAGGAIAITSSINGTRTFTTAGASAYATSKAGQLAFGQMLALELAKDRIRVNVICPGAIGTEIDDNTKKRRIGRAKVAASYRDGTVPLTGGAPGTAEQVAELAVFLASDRSSHISGTPIWIDGAQSLLV